MLAPGGLWYMVRGINPQPWEASEGQVVGKRRIHMHKPEQLRFYQQALAESFMLQNPNFVALLTGVPLKLFFLFWREIEVIEKTDGKKAYSNVADTTNLQKATEDALQDILFGNDQLNVDVRSRIVEQAIGVEPRIMIYIAPDPGLTAEEEAHVEAARQLLWKDLPTAPSIIMPNSGDDLF